MSLFNYAEEILDRLREREKKMANAILSTNFQSLEQERDSKGVRRGVLIAIDIITQLNKEFFDSKSLKPQPREQGNEVY